MSLEFNPIPSTIRDHITTKHKTQRSGLNERQIFLRKKNSRLQRAAEIKRDKTREQFFQWIEDIQEALGLAKDNAAFAAKIGVSSQMVKLWKRRVGHYPSNRSLRMLKKLEKEARIQIVDIKFVVRTRIR